MPIVIDIRADLKRAVDRLKDTERRHVPFATSVALNRTAFDLQQLEKEGLRADVKGGPVPFTVSGLQYQKSTKHNLTARVFVEAKRAKYLQWAVYGGGRKPRRKVLIVAADPWKGNPGVPRNQYGNTPAFKRFRATQLGKKRHFEATIGNVSGIWKRTGKKRKPIQLVALYAHEADYTQTVRFGRRAFRDARAIFRKHFQTAISDAIARG